VRKEEEEVMFGDITCDGGKRRDERVMCVDGIDVYEEGRRRDQQVSQLGKLHMMD
jgi:hypothetical protein